MRSRRAHRRFLNTILVALLSPAALAGSCSLTDAGDQAVETVGITWDGEHNEGNASWELRKYNPMTMLWDLVADGNGGVDGSTTYRLSGAATGDQLRLDVCWDSGAPGTPDATATLTL